MKRLTWLCATAVSSCLVTAARADDLSDATYLPSRHQFVGATSFEHGKSNGDVDSGTGAFEQSLDTITNGAAQSLSFGITDRLSVSALYARSALDAQYHFASGAYERKSLSPSGLYLGVNHRLLGQADYDFNLDLSAVVGPRGTLSMAISRRTDSFTWLARAGIYHDRSATGFDLVRDADTTIDQRWGYFGVARMQFRPATGVTLELDASYFSSNFSGGHASAVVAGQVTDFQVKQPDSLFLGAAASLQIVPDRFIARLNVGYAFIGERHDSSANPALDSVLRSSHGTSAGLSFIYAF